MIGGGNRPEKPTSFSQNVRSNMGRRSDAVKARLKNLSALLKRQKACVDDVTDSEDSDEDDVPPNQPSNPSPEPDDHGFILFEECELDSDNYIPGDSDSDDLDSDHDSDEDSEDSDLEIKNEGDLLRFSAILMEAQKVAVILEEANRTRKRPKHYSGNAPRTKRYHAQKRRELASQSQKFISQYFTEKAKIPAAAVSRSADSDTKEESIIDIDEHLDQIFGGPEDTHTGMDSPSEGSEVGSNFYSVS